MKAKLEDIFEIIARRQGAVVLKGPVGIGTSGPVSRIAAELRGKGYEVIEVWGCTTVEEILEAIALEAERLGVAYAEKLFNAFEEPEGKLDWYLERFLLKQKAVIVFHHFEENQDEQKAGAFKQERLQRFLWLFRDRLTHSETFLLFSTQYPIPGFNAPGMTRDITGFGEMVSNGKVLKGKAHLHHRLEARRHYIRASEWNEAAELTVDLCPYLMDRGYLVLAVELLRELEKRELSDKNRAEIHHCLGNIHVEFKEYEQAWSQYTRALEIAEKIDDLTYSVRYMYRIGNVYYKKGDYDAAFNRYNRAVEIGDQIGDDKGAADSLHQVGIIYHLKGDDEAAFKHVNKSLEIKKKIGDTLGVGRSLLLLGMFYYDKRDYDAALARFRECKQEYGKIAHYRGVKGVASALHWLGMAYQAIGDDDAALANYRKSNEELDTIADFRDMGYSFYQIGMIYKEKGDGDAAMKNLQEAKAVFEKNGDSQNVANCLREMDKVYRTSGDDEEEREQEEFTEFLAALTREAAAAREKSSAERERLSARLEQLIERLADTAEGRDLKSYFQLLLAIVNGKDYRQHLEEVSAELKEFFEAWKSPVP